MRETITFPRPYHRPLSSVLFCALLGALVLVLARPVSIHAERIPGARPEPGRAAVPDDGALDASSRALAPGR